MKTKISKKAARIAELERQLMEAKAAQIHNYHFSSLALEKAGEAQYMGSGLIITITALGGREIVAPTMICNGLSKETINALQADLLRSWNYACELKPRGA